MKVWETHVRYDVASFAMKLALRFPHGGGAKVDQNKTKETRIKKRERFPEWIDLWMGVFYS